MFLISVLKFVSFVISITQKSKFFSQYCQAIYSQIDSEEHFIVVQISYLKPDNCIYQYKNY